MWQTVVPFQVVRMGHLLISPSDRLVPMVDRPGQEKKGEEALGWKGGGGKVGRCPGVFGSLENGLLSL